MGFAEHPEIGTVETGVKEFPWFEDMIEICELSASAPVYPVLKREDEKYITEQGYDNPKFCEDIVRDTFLKMKEKYDPRWLRVSCRNEESIHMHDAFARLERGEADPRILRSMM